MPEKIEALNGSDITLQREVLIVGTGPAGSTAALSLARLGIKPMVINKFGWTARTPRAHITNPRTLEVLTDLGVSDDAKLYGTPFDLMGENTYCTSLAGEELGRIRTWGVKPDRALDYASASPEKFIDLPQNYMENILIGSAAHSGAEVLNHTEFLSFEQDGEGVTSTLLNCTTGVTFKVRSKFLIGADGANSKVAEQAELPFEGQMGKAGSINIVFDADLTKFVAHRPSVLYWVVQTGSDVGGLGIGTVRMVRPWHRWLTIWGYDLNDGQPDLDDHAARQIVHNLIGDASVDVRIDSVSYWTVNEFYATKLSNGRVFCMGDAVHRHPPTKGLGSNVSIQDAYNLSWKMAAVLKGDAGPEILETYSAERAPVAKQTVLGANRSVTTFPPILGALGLFDTKDPAQMVKNIDALADPSGEAVERRSALRQALEGSHDVFDNPGIELNQRYQSDAVVPGNTPVQTFNGNPEIAVHISSEPGARLPHAWVSEDQKLVSTLYIAGHGNFCLFTGPSGRGWIDAAEAVSKATGVPITVHIIGPGQRYQDVYGDFAAIREVSDSGALLVRPDVYVGWRAHEWSEGAQDNLMSAISRILAKPASERQTKVA
ncbi:FAD-dependent monooxygenase [Sphingopyxis sp. DBS4]|uniref:FAD-dependent oxidoreductase n=1 Tax=Sphingopyxis sp. DBS4 TaxID=2968500 RepID=UPI00214B2C40|nr:FAD-dependent monooxygenase [Sphingopyxis sp. DBS4]